jgi:hypothetical protein
MPWIAVSALVALLSALGICSAAFAERTSQTVSAGEQVIRVYAQELSWSRDSNPPAGSRNDVTIGRDRLLNDLPQFGKPREAVVGRDRYRLVFRTAALASIDLIATFPGGTIHARGSVDFRQHRDVFRIVGGTGAFAGAVGTAEWRFTSDDRTVTVYRIR